MNIEEVKIFISFADDAKEECELLKDVIEEENRNHFYKQGYEFIPVYWEVITPKRGRPQEDTIDPVIIDDNCKLVIIIIKNRLGNTYKDGKTGIEHEYELAKSSQKEVFIYDCDYMLKRRSEIDPDQIKRVNEFIQKVKQEILIKSPIIEKEQLKKLFRSDFAKWGNNLITNESNLSKL